MEKVEFSWSKSNLVWWSFFWRATVFGAIAGYIVAIPVSMYCMRFILNKSFKGYSLRFVKEEP
ncbi:hypothetical protein [Colwellia hornerae]|uniref:Uncharacterized protein n=1 Tax=Colwellia hornerae TaxID=89402 RepID=A0A5C6QJX9_9GAMM|nr:hypothetical protein [Colwellia hornerae]TWX53364.1 hypothetical protein ESZ28_09945 [Colwellia hornerae]TWX60184.1 hypothetical protein ESZ26_08720 [Colwellia hornerae]TWX69023.1 hypothetical protein ESZ27_06710 [Colwellia hornerae]